MLLVFLCNRGTEILVIKQLELKYLVGHNDCLVDLKSDDKYYLIHKIF